MSFELRRIFGKAAAPKPDPKNPPLPPPPPATEEPDDDEESQDQRDERHRFLVGWFQRTRGDVEYRVEQLTGFLSEGTIDSRKWADLFRKELTDAHAEAHSIGRRLAGDLGPFSEADRVAAVDAWARQEPFFEKFLADIESGRYTKPSAPSKDGAPHKPAKPSTDAEPDEGDQPSEEDKPAETEKSGPLNEKAVNARAKQYVASTRGTATESFRVALEKERLNWNLSDAVHCKPSKDFPFNCPELAAESPKPADEWETSPGRGDCPCRGECKCFWTTEDGKHSTEGI